MGQWTIRCTGSWHQARLTVPYVSHTPFDTNVKREVGTLLNGAVGPVAIRKRALQERIGQMDNQIKNKERQLAIKEDMLRKKFSRLEETMSRLKSQGGAIGAIGGFGGGGGGGLPGAGG